MTEGPPSTPPTSPSRPGRGDERGRSPKTLGPVSDLERHLPDEWWRTLFTSLYLKTDGDVVENEANTDRDVDLLIEVAGLSSEDRILDLCCGQGRHCLELARRGFENVVGLDRSRYLVRLARRRAKQAGLSVSFHEGDARRFRIRGEPFQCVAVLGNSFGYFDREEDDIAVLRSVLAALAPGGKVVLDLTDGDWMRENFERRTWEWIDPSHFVCRERSLSADRSRLVTREVITHADRGVLADQFYAERLYSPEQVLDLLGRVGFASVRRHGSVESFSDRDQDLGMMAHRLFFTAVAPPRPESRRSDGAPRDVTVLLGDPRLPDSVKREGAFAAEDLDTVSRLRDALGELKGYRFRYLDHHESLIADLAADPPPLVFNLCDEGFRNDAFLEAHVPSLLDLLGVPYTGAGPACLTLCYNKALVSAIASSLDIPVPAETYFDPTDHAATIPSAFPALVKPCYGDSSIGITVGAVVDSPTELVAYLETLRRELPGRPLLVQEYLTGSEYSVGVVGNPGIDVRVLPILEVDYSGLDPSLPPILGWESKWLPDSPYWTDIEYRQAKIDGDTRRRLADRSLTLFERLGCRDYARFDYRADASGEIKLLEVNPNPGWCWDGKLNLMAEMEGLTYADLLRLIIEAAEDRVASARLAQRSTAALVAGASTGARVVHPSPRP